MRSLVLCCVDFTGVAVEVSGTSFAQTLEKKRQIIIAEKNSPHLVQTSFSLPSIGSLKNNVSSLKSRNRFA